MIMHLKWETYFRRKKQNIKVLILETKVNLNVKL